MSGMPSRLRLGGMPSFATGSARTRGRPASPGVPSSGGESRAPAVSSAVREAAGADGLSRSAMETRAIGPRVVRAEPRPRRQERRAPQRLRKGDPWVRMDADHFAGGLHERARPKGSTPFSFAVENAGALTATKGGRHELAVRPAELLERPSAIRTDSSTIGTPVTFDMNGTVRDARGLTSIR